MARNAEVDLSTHRQIPLRLDPDLDKDLTREMKARKLPSLASCIRTLLREALAK